MLVINRTNELGADIPGLHALIIGISDYSYLSKAEDLAGGRPFGFTKVTGPAASAVSLACWLAATGTDYTMASPLKTLRLLLLPSGDEAKWPGGAPGTPNVDEVVQAVESWRNDCNSCDGQNIALFYFSGHGINVSTDDALLAMGDIGHPNDSPYTLQRFIRVQSIFQAMRPSSLYMNMALRQLYFIDACRTDNLDAIESGGKSDRVIGGTRLDWNERRRSAPLYFAALPGDPAFAPSPAGTAYGDALLRCLNHSSGDLRYDDHGNAAYAINTLSLRVALNNQMARQLPVMGYLPSDMDIVSHKEPPDIELWVNALPPDRGKQIKLVARNVDLGRDVDPIAPIGSDIFKAKTVVGRHSFTVSAMAGDPQIRIIPPRTLIGPVERLVVDVRL